MLISTDNSGLLHGANAINGGELVAFPTDTYFALGADGFNSKAVESVFVTKGRNPGTPVPLLVSDSNMATSLVRDFPAPLKQLADHFWPGALTVVLPANDRVPDVVTARTGTVGVRVPDNDVARKLIELSGVPITGTSCNLTGRDPIKEAVVVDQVFGDQVPVVLDGACGDSTAASTVISFEDKRVVVLREGAISAESLRNIVGDIVVS
ncbi:L-threonylcarbamoyladenylate synthase [Candidatus Lucifugimonas marina]|uniref:L-threonylcarbamoyladenylate synthase n=1 Tax=Candidatus Lucifugimonas marina TaxID=3038979 RepID=A0AAJ6CTA6_9CHLR|nr:threonylcarbamoyl-AMP synthase [SAR202 cluster bacterium JH702]MDG0868743.1 threonylcarbamoyl-AMP synthase [SAR202 cluster bacterium JH639]WFG35375.1 threonylcarbamoyl-AMP synthase [SAR202 cluster bacterium JH545]WFG39322.1 threonylcarbamoyl-AMP synthase [SAR202 cluster bacterium JH1073]